LNLELICDGYERNVHTKQLLDCYQLSKMLSPTVSLLNPPAEACKPCPYQIMYMMGVLIMVARSLEV